MVNLPWARFLPWFTKQWAAGEHVTIIGPTGSGKSYLALQLIKTRSYYILLLTKGKDKTLDRFIAREDIDIIRRWPPDGFTQKVALWPRFTGAESFQHQHTVFREAINGYVKGGRKIDGIYTEGVWTVLIDEVMYFKEELHLETELRMLWTQGRSNDISLVAGSQRPRDVPQLMLNQWSHLFVFQTSDRYEIQRLSDIGGNISQIIKDTVPRLNRHEFLYLNRVTAEAVRSKVS